MKWLRSAQHGTGGWSLVGGASSNSQSTAWAVQGLVAAGKNPGSFRPKGTNPYKYLKRRQRSDGHYEYSSASDQTPVWVTAQGLAAAYSTEFPIEAVERAPKPPKKKNDGSTGTGSFNYDSGYTAPDYGDPGSYDFGNGGGNGLNDLYESGGNGNKAPGPTAATARPRTARDPSSRTRRRPRAAPAVQRIPANPEASETAAAGDDGDQFEAPSTPVLLGGLGGLTALLGAGFLWFSRRLP